MAPHDDGCPFGQINREKVEQIERRVATMEELMARAQERTEKQVEAIYAKIDNHLRHMTATLIAVVGLAATVIGVLSAFLAVAARR
jgi:peptide deformylase